jgi:hypothetical protein
MPALLPVILTATHLVLTAREVPHLNIEPSCHAAAGVSIRHGSPNASACLRDEQRARAKLKKQWSTFTGAERQRCVALARLGGPPSYVELLTCLQMAKTAKNLPTDGEMNGRAGR